MNPTGPDGKPLTAEQMAMQTQQIIYMQQQAIQQYQQQLLFMMQMQAQNPSHAAQQQPMGMFPMMGMMPQMYPQFNGQPNNGSQGK